jgi:hypothetical protein
MINKAARLLDTTEDLLQEFTEIDPFSNNQLYGYICRESTHNYGAMVLYKINEENTEQVIYCTPKLEYPFDKGGHFHWPPITQLEIWDKLDGTNILAYHYIYNNKDYVTFKTRLSVILKNGRFGNFLNLWKECLTNSKWIKNTIQMNPEFNLSFELYGFRNPHTITYNVPLDTVLLFGVDKDHKIKPPSQLNLDKDNVKLPTYIQSEKKSDLTSTYEKLRSEMSAINNKLKDEFTVEGVVLYAFTDEHIWRQFKCKPEEIQQIHWSNSSIPKRELWNTAINSFEEGNSSIEHFTKLLREEYTNQQIGRIEQKIKKVFYEAKQHVEFVQKVNHCWDEAKKQGFDITKNKADTFRFLSKFFEKKEMKKVGRVVLRQII